MASTEEQPKSDSSAAATSAKRRAKTPEESAWFLSKVFFSWESPLFRKANELAKEEKPLELEHLLDLPEIDHSDKVGPLFEQFWAKNEATAPKKTVNIDDLKNKDNMETTRIQKTLYNVVGTRFLIAGVVKFFNTALQFSFPLLLNAILAFIEETQAGIIDPKEDPWYVVYRGYWLSAILFLTMGGKAICENHYFHMVFRAAYQARLSVSVAVYNKSLRLTSAARQSTTLGELINLMQVDATKIEMFVPQAHVLWDGMFQIIGYIAILYTLIGWPVFIGLAVMIMAGPVQGKVMGKLFGLNRSMVKYTDARVEKTNEALQGIQSVKMYTWEDKFAKTISESRQEEVNVLKSVAQLRGFSRAYMGALPGVVAVSSYVVYALAYDGDISASTLFAALIAFDQLRFPLLFYPVALAQLAQAKVSAARVELFLGLKEIGKDDIVGGGKFSRDSSGPGEIIVEDATAFWSDPKVPLATTDKSDDASSLTATIHDNTSMSGDSEEGDVKYPKPSLKDVSLHIAPGELCAIVGRVASGKSSLCSAVLNEMLLDSGSITLKGKVAYAAQSPWILNATLRDNILFGLPMDQERYDRVLAACQLSHDLDMLEDGDLTGKCIFWCTKQIKSMNTEMSNLL
jgi:ABC-type multidrug transport system fused ATPase/permease subunit